MKSLLPFLLLWLLPVMMRASESDSIVKQTFVYAVKGTDTLRLDKYDTPTATAEKKPCLIFVFGGGFAAGTRDNADYLPFYQQMMHLGYTVVAIDYRLGMKNLKQKITPTRSKLKFGTQVINIFDHSINMAVEDLFDATNYVASHAAQWRIDTAQIVACGSSAGGITVLQGEYERCNASKLAEHLPQGFRYAGVISFAGAVFTTNGRLKWAGNPAPMLLFHGDIDREVPYDKLKLCKIGFYGSAQLAKQLKKQRAAHWFYSVENVGHRISTSPMYKNYDEIHTFLTKWVADKEPLIMETSLKPTGKQKGKKKLTLRMFMGNF